MDHLLPEGAKPLITLAYDCEEDEYYEKIPKKGFEYSEFYNRVGWAYEDAWAHPIHSEDLLGGVEEGAQDKVRKPWQIEKFFQTWLFFGLIIEVFDLSGIEVKTTDFLAPIVRKSVHKPQTARLITTSKLPGLIMEWRKRHESSSNEAVFDRTHKLLDHVGKILDYHCVGGKDHRSPRQYGKVLWPVSDDTTTAIIAVASALRKASFIIYDKRGIENRWPVTNSLLLYQRIQRKWCRSDAAMIMEDFDIDGQAYIAAAPSRALDELDSHYACTDHSCEARVSDGTYVVKHDPECHKDDYAPEPKFLGHKFPEYGKSPVSLRDAIKDVMTANHLPVLRWNSNPDPEQAGFTTYGHRKNSYSEESSKVPPFVAISHV